MSCRKIVIASMMHETNTFSRKRARCSDRHSTHSRLVADVRSYDDLLHRGFSTSLTVESCSQAPMR
jgi:hypothetical protein